jgi:hypothetical protein
LKEIQSQNADLQAQLEKAQQELQSLIDANQAKQQVWNVLDSVNQDKIRFIPASPAVTILNK